jgi:hypothetical protein
MFAFFKSVISIHQRERERGDVIQWVWHDKSVKAPRPISSVVCASRREGLSQGPPAGKYKIETRGWVRKES